MYKILPADKDTYITNKIVNSLPCVSSNVGLAGSLDLFKLYGITKTGNISNTEISRLLIHFDLSQFVEDVNNGIIDVNDPSFWAKINLKDVYGGQTTPNNFYIDIYPLSSSFEVGLGKDVVYYQDQNSSNWLSSSFGNEWFLEGCGYSTTSSNPGDYIAGTNSLVSTKYSQFFKTGTEDLLVDVTNLLSSTISGEIPDEGFRLSFNDQIENDQQTYFVKRFGSRHAYNESKRPRIIYGFDDSITDDTQNLVFDTNCSIKLYNYIQGQLQNIFSSSAEILGDNCLKFVLSTEYPAPSSSFYYNLYFSGSQFSKGINYLTGVYETTLFVPSNDQIISEKIQLSGSVKFHTSWVSEDLSAVYAKCSDVTINLPTRTSDSKNGRKLQVSVTGVQNSYFANSEPILRVNIFDYGDPFIKVVKLPVELPGITLKSVYYSVRNIETGETVIPFDDLKNSTRVSSDSQGMFFKLYTSPLLKGNTYVVDIMISNNGNKLIFPSASPAFRIE